MGKPIEITRLDHTASELRAIAARTRDGRVARRLLALALILDGHDRREAARVSGMDRQTIRDWVIRFNETGVAGLANCAVPGRTPRLSTAQLAEVKAIVLAGPDLEKHGVVRWRCVDLQGVIADRFGVRFHEATVGKLLGKLNLTRLQPRPAHPGKSPEAEADFKKTLPTSLAKPSPTALAASGSRSGSRMRPAWDSKAR
jgi:transposase